MSTILPTLYSRTSLGQLAQWSIEFDQNRFRTHEGIVDGTITTSEWTICLGKNVGRANETSPIVQAEREARAKWKKKTEKGYYEDAARVDEEMYFEPMLAHKWEDHKDDVEWPVASQGKLDGTRCVGRESGLWSRNGKPVVSAPHVLEAILPILTSHPGLVLDGELYADHLAHDFDRLMSLARQSKPMEDDLAASRAELEYWVYDCDDGTGKTFEERTAFLQSLKGELPPYVKIVDTDIAHDQAELDAFYEDYLKRGLEGQMVRKLKSAYERKRSRNLLKRKEFVDEEFILVDLEEGRGNRAGMATRAILRLEDGRTFEAGMIGGFEYCRKLLADKANVIGKPATVQYQNLTPDGKPRFAKLKAIREEE